MAWVNLHRDEIREVLNHLRSLLEHLGQSLSYANEIAALKKELAAEQAKTNRLQFEHERALIKQREDFERAERELRHMIGLEKKRQEAEQADHTRALALAVRETELKTKETAVTNDRIALDDAIVRFDAVVKRLEAKRLRGIS